MFKKSHSADVLLLTPSTLNIEMIDRGFVTSGMTRPASFVKSNELHRAYADAVVRVGAKTGSPVVDLYKVFDARSHPEELFTDGTHYAPKGYAVSENDRFCQR
jgi:lysophospholipase L1-like esterase